MVGLLAIDVSTRILEDAAADIRYTGSFEIKSCCLACSRFMVACKCTRRIDLGVASVSSRIDYNLHTYDKNLSAKSMAQSFAHPHPS